MGRKVILFHSFNNSIPTHPFRAETYLEEARELNGDTRAFEAEFARFAAQYPHLVRIRMGDMSRSLEVLAREFGAEAGFVNGEVSGSKVRAAIKAFNTDHSPVNLLVAQMEKAKEGVSLHDTTGVHQRVVMTVALPVKPTDAIQSEGRAYRVGLASNAITEYIVLHTGMERYAFGSKINQRVSTAENLALGSQARSLKDRFRDGYLNATTNEPGENQGLGGKAADYATETMSRFDQAKTYYFGRQKRHPPTRAPKARTTTPRPSRSVSRWWNGRDFAPGKRARAERRTRRHREVLPGLHQEQVHRAVHSAGR